MKVYVLEYQKWEDHYIVGIFTSLELAENHLQGLKESRSFNLRNYTITEETLISE